MAAGASGKSAVIAPWQAYLDQAFPNYVLPAAMHKAIDPQTAARFLQRFRLPPDHLDLLLCTSLIVAYANELQPLCSHLADLVRALPSRTTVSRRVWDGGFHGRLALAETMARRLAGSPTRFVTQTRARTLDLPENQLVLAVAARLLGIIADLRKKKLMAKKHWADAALGCEDELRRLVHSSVLREVPATPAITAHHEQAAAAARHPCYQLALQWHQWMNDALDCPDDRRLAQTLADGALRPEREFIQFEIAVVIRLIEAIWTFCEREQAGRWIYECSIIMPKRRDIARFCRAGDGASIEVFYNTIELPGKGLLGPRDRGVRHYFDNSGRFQPDITVLIRRPGQPPHGMIVEIKHSANPETLNQGYQEALLYRFEYDGHLIDWPKAVLVCSGDIHGTVSTDHEVVAVAWQHWVPTEIIGALVPALTGA